MADDRDWTGAFYQYANRLAHLYLLLELNGVPAFLVFLYFTGDTEMAGPATCDEWNAVRYQMHDSLGLSPDPLPHVIDVHVDVRTLAHPHASEVAES